MRGTAIFADLKSLLSLFGLLVLAVLTFLSLVAAVGMIFILLDGADAPAREVAPALAVVYGMFAVVFGGMFVGLLWSQVRMLRSGKSTEIR